MAQETTPETPNLVWREERLGPLSLGSIVARPIMLRIPSTEPPEGGFPFLVITDGDLAFDEEWFGVDEALARLVNEGDLEPWVLIAVPSVDRTSELTPSLESQQALRRGRRLDAPRRGVEAFADFVVRTVLPAVEESVPLSSKGAVLGYSFGGLAAVHFALRYPERFPRVVAMSPSLWFAQRAVLFAVEDAEELPERVWLDVGTHEGRPNQEFPYMVADARQLREDLRRRGVMLGYYEALNRPHGSNEAGPRMEHALRYALSDDECDPVRLELHVFRQRARPRETVPSTLLGFCADGSPRTIPSGDAVFHVTNGRVNRDGHVTRATSGDVTLEATHGGLHAETRLSFRSR